MYNRKTIRRTISTILNIVVVLSLTLASFGSAFAKSNSNSYILVGGGNSDLYVYCDLESWHCTGTYDYDAATRFRPIRVVGKVYRQWQVQGTRLCLNVWGGTNDVNIYTCGSDDIGDNELFARTTSQIGQVPAIMAKYNNNRMLWWQGDGRQIVTVPTCVLAWQCVWRWQRVN